MSNSGQDIGWKQVGGSRRGGGAQARKEGWNGGSAGPPLGEAKQRTMNTLLKKGYSQYYLKEAHDNTVEGILSLVSDEAEGWLLAEKDADRNCHGMDKVEMKSKGDGYYANVWLKPPAGKEGESLKLTDENGNKLHFMQDEFRGKKPVKVGYLTLPSYLNLGEGVYPNEYVRNFALGVAGLNFSGKVKVFQTSVHEVRGVWMVATDGELAAKTLRKQWMKVVADNGEEAPRHGGKLVRLVAGEEAVNIAKQNMGATGDRKINLFGSDMDGMTDVLLKATLVKAGYKVAWAGMKTDKNGRSYGQVLSWTEEDSDKLLEALGEGKVETLEYVNAKPILPHVQGGRREEEQAPFAPYQQPFPAWQAESILHGSNAWQVPLVNNQNVEQSDNTQVVVMVREELQTLGKKLAESLAGDGMSGQRGVLTAATTEAFKQAAQAEEACRQKTGVYEAKLWDLMSDVNMDKDVKIGAIQCVNTMLSGLQEGARNAHTRAMELMKREVEVGLPTRMRICPTTKETEEVRVEDAEMNSDEGLAGTKRDRAPGLEEGGVGGGGDVEAGGAGKHTNGENSKGGGAVQY